MREDTAVDMVVGIRRRVMGEKRTVRMSDKRRRRRRRRRHGETMKITKQSKLLHFGGLLFLPIMKSLLFFAKVDATTWGTVTRQE